MRCLLFAFLLAFATQAYAANWALLVAGSNGYYNYRHQSDVCHAFQVLTQKGHFPKENVIVMMYDDIANDPQNPVPGNIINKPNGPNVYLGVNKDYTGEQVTAQNFLNVLGGNAAAMRGIGSGKVINSTSEDHVFVYFADHGAPGLVAMPSGPYLYANQLIPLLKTMAQKKQFKQLVFYMEACESGSMFENLLPTNINVFATTAANSQQSSYAFYYDTSRGTYLGDEYSIHWLEDSDKENFGTWTLEEQYKLVASLTKQSQPQQFGELSMGSESIGTFQSFENSFSNISIPKSVAPSYLADPVDSRDVKLEILRRRWLSASGPEKEKYFALVENELLHRTHSDTIFLGLVDKLSGPQRRLEMMTKYRAPRDFDCLRNSIESVEKKCGRFSDYSLKHVRVLVNLCEEGFSAEQIADSVQNLC
eukprot:TRINITY_DN1598_c0_g1_i1.p1 TRINITY_DN1598_c0_g1~~TRINITY_DN1598_c0_g1_i1.p1  ORF type:complete len:421 (+),score=66.80 TRINITY_DN1598_c0_g1_i1:77-1339(+)